MFGRGATINISSAKRVYYSRNMYDRRRKQNATNNGVAVASSLHHGPTDEYFSPQSKILTLHTAGLIEVRRVKKYF